MIVLALSEEQLPITSKEPTLSLSSLDDWPNIMRYGCWGEHMSELYMYMFMCFSRLSEERSDKIKIQKLMVKK